MPADDTPERGNAERLCAAIDQGRTADKVAVSDPAAAPLGTDDEVGGHPPGTHEVERPLHQETEPHIPADTAARRPDRLGRRSAPWLLAMVIVGLALIGATGLVILP